MSEGPLAVRFAFLLSKHVSACIKRLTLGKVQPLDVEQWPVIQGNQNGAGGETAPHAHRQPGEPGAGVSTTIKLLTDNIYCRPTSLFINFSCTNVSQNLLMPTFLHQFVLNGPCPQPHLHPCPRPRSGSAGLRGAVSPSPSLLAALHSLCITGCMSRTEWRMNLLNSEYQSMRIWLYKHSDLKDVSDLSIFLQIPSNWCESNPEI